MDKGDDAKVYKVSETFDVETFLNYLASASAQEPSPEPATEQEIEQLLRNESDICSLDLNNGTRVFVRPADDDLLELVYLQDGLERVLKTDFMNGDRPVNEWVRLEPITDFMGSDGFRFVYERMTGFCYYDYYSVDEIGVHLIAESFNCTDELEDLGEWLVDLDGDGVDEFVANCYWGGSGVISTEVYRRTATGVEKGYLNWSDDPPFDYEDYGIHSRWTGYDPERQVFVLHYDNGGTEFALKEYGYNSIKFNSYLDTFHGALRGLTKIENVETGEKQYLSEILDEEVQKEIAAFTLVDLDLNCIPELILWVELNGGAAAYFEILECWDGGSVHSYSMPYRGFTELKRDGSFSYSGGACDHGFGWIQLSAGTVHSKPIAYCKSSSDPTGEMSVLVSYFVNGKEVLSEEFDAACSAQDQKENAVWYEYTEENIDRVLGGM